MQQCCCSFSGQNGASAANSGVLSQASRPPGYQDAVDEARIAAEQIVIPRQQAIELLPRTEQLLNVQVRADAQLIVRSGNSRMAIALQYCKALVCLHACVGL